MVESSSAESQSPARFQHMAAELDAVDREIRYYVCQWGIGVDTGEWASKIGNSWRISNDIYNAWRSIWRITNQFVPYYRHTTVGAFADMDMLIVGLNALSEEEERFHFSMWAINKSPLIIGATVDPEKLNKHSLDIMSNKEIIALNQDPLAKQAQLVRRYTEEEYDIWLGELSGSRHVLGFANWKNDSQSIEIDLSSLGIGNAQARDIWAAKDLGSVEGIQKLDLVGHELRLWVLANTTAAAPLRSTNYYGASNGTFAGSAKVVVCSSGTCLPTGSKIGSISLGSSATFTKVTASSSGKKLIGVDFVNYDYAFTTAWEWGDNTRNATIAVNGAAPKRWAFPLSGGDWEESGRLLIETDGFVEGSNNTVVIDGFGNATALAPDFVGFEVLE